MDSADRGGRDWEAVGVTIKPHALTARKSSFLLSIPNSPHPIRNKLISLSLTLIERPSNYFDTDEASLDCKVISLPTSKMNQADLCRESSEQANDKESNAVFRFKDAVELFFEQSIEKNGCVKQRSIWVYCDILVNAESNGSNSAIWYSVIPLQNNPSCLATVHEYGADFGNPSSPVGVLRLSMSTFTLPTFPIDVALVKDGEQASFKRVPRTQLETSAALGNAETLDDKAASSRPPLADRARPGFHTVYYFKPNRFVYARPRVATQISSTGPPPLNPYFRGQRQIHSYGKYEPSGVRTAGLTARKEREGMGDTGAGCGRGRAFEESLYRNGKLMFDPSSDLLNGRWSVDPYQVQWKSQLGQYDKRLNESKLVELSSRNRDQGACFNLSEVPHMHQQVKSSQKFLSDALNANRNKLENSLEQLKLLDFDSSTLLKNPNFMKDIENLAGDMGELKLRGGSSLPDHLHREAWQKLMEALRKHLCYKQATGTQKGAVDASISAIIEKKPGKQRIYSLLMLDLQSARSIDRIKRIELKRREGKQFAKYVPLGLTPGKREGLEVGYEAATSFSWDDGYNWADKSAIYFSLWVEISNPDPNFGKTKFNIGLATLVSPSLTSTEKPPRFSTIAALLRAISELFPTDVTINLHRILVEGDFTTIFDFSIPILGYQTLASRTDNKSNRLAGLSKQLPQKQYDDALTYVAGYLRKLSTQVSDSIAILKVVLHPAQPLSVACIPPQDSITLKTLLYSKSHNSKSSYTQKGQSYHAQHGSDSLKITDRDTAGGPSTQGNLGPRPYYEELRIPQRYCKLCFCKKQTLLWTNDSLSWRESTLRTLECLKTLRSSSAGFTAVTSNAEGRKFVVKAVKTSMLKCAQEFISYWINYGDLQAAPDGSSKSEGGCSLHITPLLALYSDASTIYLVTRYMYKCIPLRDLLLKCTSFPEKRVKAWLADIVRTLEISHSRGLAQFDIYPNRIFVTEPELRIRFGIPSMRHWYQSAEISGNLASWDPNGISWSYPIPLSYVPPESIFSRKRHPSPKFDLNVSAAADIWMVGILAYHLINGSPPFIATTADSLSCMLKSRKAIAASLLNLVHATNAFKDFVACALVIEVNKRFSASALCKHKWIRTKTLSAAATIT